MVLDQYSVSAAIKLWVSASVSGRKSDVGPSLINTELLPCFINEVIHSSAFDQSKTALQTFLWEYRKCFNITRSFWSVSKWISLDVFMTLCRGVNLLQPHDSITFHLSTIRIQSVCCILHFLYYCTGHMTTFPSVNTSRQINLNSLFSLKVLPEVTQCPPHTNCLFVELNIAFTHSRQQTSE